MEDQDNNSRPLIEKTAERLIQYIINQDLKKGEKLPNERRLGELLEVGRGTLREALRILTSHNILEVRHGAGIFISDKNGVPDDPLGLTFIKDKRKLINDLLDFRIWIEPRVAALAAQNADEKDVQELEQLCNEVDEYILAGKSHIQKDAEFHGKIAECSRNLIMPNLLPILHSALNLFVKETGCTLPAETMKTHHAILNAIKEKDATAAYDGIFLHLIYNRDRLRERQFLNQAVD